MTAGEKVKESGLIIGRSGEALTVKTNDMGNITVVLTDDTKVEQPKGLLKVRKTDMGMAVLVPGLAVQVEGVGDANGRVTAEKIKFSEGIPQGCKSNTSWTDAYERRCAGQ